VEKEGCCAVRPEKLTRVSFGYSLYGIALPVCFVRSPNSSNSNNVRNVNTTGTLNNNNAYNGNNGVRPASVDTETK